MMDSLGAKGSSRDACNRMPARARDTCDQASAHDACNQASARDAHAQELGQGNGLLAHAPDMECDVVVIGAGLLGCFVADNLMRHRLHAIIIDQNLDICEGISKANTSIVYSGAYSKPGTLKTELCTRANRSFDTLCNDLGVRFHRCGSLMACSGPQGAGTLERFLENGRASGVDGLRILSGAEARLMEPGLAPNVTGALYDPNMGTVIPWELGIAAAQRASRNGARFCLGTRAVGIARNGSGGYDVSVVPVAGVARPIGRAIGMPESPLVLHTRMVVNCSGLSAGTVFDMVCEPRVRIVPQKGVYRVLDTKAAGALRHVVMHEPEDHSKGLTLVPTVGGNILIGPTEEDSQGEWDTATTEAGLAWLDEQVSHVFPGLPLQHTIRSFAAVRPNPFWIQRDEGSGQYAVDSRSISSFVILEPDEAPGFISLVGIKTPGLTCANELGALVASKAVSYLGGAEENSHFAEHMDAPRRAAEIPLEERKALVAADPAFGRIVCRCREVSEGEIAQALLQVPSPVTLDGIKRRADAGMGRCQGSFCSQRIIEMLAAYLGVAASQVEKSVPGSNPIIKEGAAITGREGGDDIAQLLCGAIPDRARLAIIGGGAAGCAAALSASEAGLDGIIVCERAPLLGGILDQCVHTGFGSIVYGEDMAGTEFADRLVGQLREGCGHVHVALDTTVTSLRPDAGNPRGGAILAMSGPALGVGEMHADGVIIATGCRERPMGALPIAGTRPAGVFTAGAVQKMLDLGGYGIGRHAVILGSGDVGLIVARQLALSGCEVIAVVEQAGKCGGLDYNRRRCLDAFGIPLMLETTVSEVRGEARVSGVVLRRLSDGTEAELECDALVTSVGLVPELDLLDGFGRDLPEWLAICGNADGAYGLVDMLVEDAADTGARMARLLRQPPAERNRSSNLL